MIAYFVPAVSVAGVAKLTVYHCEKPGLKPGSVTDAMSGAMGTPPLVARRLTVRFGVVPVQPEQKSLRSTRTRGPLTEGVIVCPSQVVVVVPTPLLPRVVFCWLRFSTWSTSLTSFGLVVRSTLLGTPVWKSAWVVSVRHALRGALSSAKSCVLVPPSVMTIGAADSGTNPGELTMTLV